MQNSALRCGNRTPELAAATRPSTQAPSSGVHGRQRPGALRLVWPFLLAIGLPAVACNSGSSESGETSGPEGTAGTEGSADAAGASSIGYDIQVDPYGNSPLVAVVNLRGIETSDVQSIEVVVTGQDGAPDFVKTYSPTDTDLEVNMDTSDLTFPEAGYHVPVLGLYPDCRNVVRIRVDLLDRDAVDLTLDIETRLARADEAAWVPGIQVNSAVPELMEPGWTVAEISIEPNPNPPIVFVDWTRTIAFDERGAIRWALRLDELPKGETFTLRRSITGNFLTGSFDTIVELTKLGRIVREYRLSEYTLNHEIVQIGSDDSGQGVPSGTESEYYGNILVLASKNGAPTVQDRVVELDEDTGVVLDAWDFSTVLDPTRTTFVDPEEWAPGAGDWFHDNGIAYSQTDESIIVSGRHQGVAKIRRDGSLVWLLAPHRGWNEPQSQKLLTAVRASGTPYDEPVQLGDEAAGDPAAPEFDWPFGQHSPTLLPNGDLLLFDNGCSRHWGAMMGSFSRAVVYRIDEATMTIRQMGQLVLSRSESSFFVSNTQRLPVTGNVLVQPGGSAWSPAVVKEVTTQVAGDGTFSFGTVAFDAELDLSAIDADRWYVYSYRGHRWTF